MPSEAGRRVTLAARYMRHSLAVTPCVLVLLAGCHVWRRSPDTLAQPLEERARVQLWSRGNAYVVHGVRVRGDSVTAVPYWLPPNCDSCALRLPLTLVDSVRIQRSAEGPTIALTTVLVGIGATIIWFLESLAHYGT